MVGLSLDDIRKLRGERKELVEEVSQSGRDGINK